MWHKNIWKIMTEFFPSLFKAINPLFKKLNKAQVLEPWRKLHKAHYNQMLKTSGKGNLESSQNKTHLVVEQKMTADLHQNQHKWEDNGTSLIHCNKLSTQHSINPANFFLTEYKINTFPNRQTKAYRIYHQQTCTTRNAKEVLQIERKWQQKEMWIFIKEWKMPKW